MWVGWLAKLMPGVDTHQAALDQRHVQVGVVLAAGDPGALQAGQRVRVRSVGAGGVRQAKGVPRLLCTWA